MYLCVDGLDELAVKEQQGLFGLVEKMLSAHIHVFTSSRRTPQLYAFLQERTMGAGRAYQLNISESDCQREDILRYIDSSVLSSGRLEGKPELQQQIVHTIGARSHGM